MMTTKRMDVVYGPPGSGKSTVFPFLAHRETGKPVLVAEPTRLAAVSLARYCGARASGGFYCLPPGLHPEIYQMAGEQIPISGEIGYAVRGDNRLPPLSLLAVGYITTGIAIQMALGGALEEAYFVIDEVHLRTIEMDALFALLVKDGRPFAIMTATPAGIEPLLETADRHGYAIVPHEFPAVTHPFRVIELDAGVLPREAKIMEALRRAPGAPGEVEFALNARRDGLPEYAIRWNGRHYHVLIFVPGVQEAEELAEYLSRRFSNPAIPVHGSLTLEELHEVIAMAEDQSRTRFFVSTNVSAVAVTLNAGLVIDTGQVRIGGVDQSQRVWLDLTHVSRAEARQRAGRAGRSAPGLAIRLYREAELGRDSDPPEIRLSTPERAVLVAAARGLDLSELPLPEKPDEAAVAEALDHLRQVGAIGPAGEGLRLTDRGWKILRLGLPSAIAVPILRAFEDRLERDDLLRLLMACSVLAVGRPWRRPLREEREEHERDNPWAFRGDLASALNALKLLALASPWERRMVLRELRQLGFHTRPLDDALHVFLPDLLEKAGDLFSFRATREEALRVPCDEEHEWVLGRYMAEGMPGNRCEVIRQGEEPSFLRGDRLGLVHFALESCFPRSHPSAAQALAVRLRRIRHGVIASAVLPLREG